MVDQPEVPASDRTFVDIPAEEWVASNDRAFAIRDRFPVATGHTLVIPKRIVTNWWDADDDERSALFALVDEVKSGLDLEFSPSGYNVGFNDGLAAGQTVMHLHVHVIPRYDGDVPDPTGGVRHVIPGMGNYLAGRTHQPSDATTLERNVAGQLDTSAFLQRLLTIIDEGRRSATYKPALLLALMELSTERVSGADPLRIPLDDVAERIMELYWPHTREYPETHLVLNQVTGGRGRILGALAELRSTSAAKTNTALTAVRAADPVAYAKTRSVVARALAKQPVPRLQRLGTDASISQYPRFLFDDSRFVAERGALDADPEVVLLPGVAEALTRAAPLLRIAVQDVWTREVAAINRLHQGEDDLRHFLFGAGRVNLSPVADGLRNLGVQHCFWCDQSLGADTQVDHVIPWSYYANNDLSNLVLADRACNGDKRDRLVTAPLVERWLMRDLTPLTELGAELQWSVDLRRAKDVARSAYRYLPDGIPLWGGRRTLELMDAPDRQRISMLLDESKC